jgi:hypothetical protein
MLTYDYRNAAATADSAEQFMRRIESLVNPKGRHLQVFCPNLLGSRATVIVVLINLPESESEHGAQAANNTVRFHVDGFDHKDTNAPAPRGKVQVEQAIIGLYTPEGDYVGDKYRLRRKTGVPDKIAKYIADQIHKIVSELEPYYSDAKYKR